VTSPGAVGHAAQSVDDAAASTFAAEYAECWRQLPPVAIVIAAYNEEGTIGPVIDALPASVCGLATATIVVVDGSVDGTAGEAGAHGALVCDVPANRGQGAALRLGYRLAREGGARYIVTTDADGQYDPADAQRLLEPVLAGDADFVTGSRTLGSEETKDPVRKLGVRVFAAMISLLTGQRVTDPSFGMRAMRVEVTGAVQLQQPQYQAAELLIGVIARGFRVAERPATIRKRRVGESKKGHNVLYGLRFAGVIVGTWWRERRQRNQRGQRAAGQRAAGQRAGGKRAGGQRGQSAGDFSLNSSSAGTTRPRAAGGTAAGTGATGGAFVDLSAAAAADLAAGTLGNAAEGCAETLAPRSAKRT
jgi:Glycosyl transferase family 2